MRQVNIRMLRSGLKQEMQNLPFEIVRNGRIVGVMCTRLDYECVHNATETMQKGTDNAQGVHNLAKVTKEQLTEITKKKEKVLTKKTIIPTAKTSWVNPLTGSTLAPKK